MTNNTQELKRRLAHVRRRWKMTAALHGLVPMATEVIGLFLVLALADYLYDFSGMVRLGLLAALLAVAAVAFVRYVVRPLLRPISNSQLALFVEERSPLVEGTVLSAWEQAEHPQPDAVGRLIGNLLVTDAVRRIDGTKQWRFSHLGRLRKHFLLALALMLVFATIGVWSPSLAKKRGQRIIAPWISIRLEREQAHLERERRLALERELYGPIVFEVQPGDVQLLRGSATNISVRLSRQPPDKPQLMYRFAGTKDWKSMLLEDRDILYGYARRFEDINEGFEYYVAAARQKSPVYTVRVYDPLAVRSIELTYHYPAYLELDPQTAVGASGDISAVAGTKVDVRIVANNQLKAGTLKFDDQQTVALTPGEKSADGLKGTIAVEKNRTYTFQVSDVYGGQADSAQFFFVKAVPDEPPTVQMTSPKVDMSIHPLCEITFAAKVKDDWALKDAKVNVSCYRGGQVQAMPLVMKPSSPGGTYKNFKDGTVECVLELEQLNPPPKPGDMIFYHMEVTDRKGQTVKTDLFFAKLVPLEVVGVWPAGTTPPDLPHWDYRWTPDMILIAAAAWSIEQQRSQLPQADFQAKCTELVERMEPSMANFGTKELGARTIPREQQLQLQAQLAGGREKLQKGHDLIAAFEPGKGAALIQDAMASLESLIPDKHVIQNLGLAQAPIHTGQPSGGFSQDAVAEQMLFRSPPIISDSLTAFQQQDNPHHFLPPDYRRVLRLKDQTAPLMKELMLADTIYASQEQLVEMAREFLGHRLLRTAADLTTRNDPSAGSGVKGETIKVDKRAVPWASMDGTAPLVSSQRGKLNESKSERVKGLKYAKLTDNERAGAPSPHQSQTPGGGTPQKDEKDEEEPQAEKPRPKLDLDWEVKTAPKTSQGGGGGGGGSRQQQQQQQTPQDMEQPQQAGSPGGGSRSPQDEMAEKQLALAAQTAQMAQNVARKSEPGNELGDRAADASREASRHMREAAEQFRRGAFRDGLESARQAQQQLRGAMHGMEASQFGNLEQALAAAQDGASVLRENQRRVSDSTRQAATRAAELTAGGARENGARPSGHETGQPQAGSPRSGGQQQQQGQPQGGQPQGQQQGQPQGQQPTGAPASRARQESSGSAQGAGGQPQGPSREALQEAMGYDPRLGSQIQSLAGEQTSLSESVRDFDAYVADLAKWAAESKKDRVATSLKDVADTIRREDVAQKMVDAGVDLSQNDMRAARQAQTQIEGALGRIADRVQEAGAVLAGSPTAMLSAAARQAAQIGGDVRRLAGLSLPDPRSGAQSQGQAGQGQPQPQEQGTRRAGQMSPPQSGGQSGQAAGQQPQAPPSPSPPTPSLSKTLAQQAAQSSSTTAGKPGPDDSMGGFRGGNEVDGLWLQAKKLTETLDREQLVDEKTLNQMRQRVTDAESFRRMFDLAQKAEAGHFANLMTGVGKNLDQMLEETLSAKRLREQQREESPPKYRSFVSAYFESLSKITTEKKEAPGSAPPARPTP